MPPLRAAGLTALAAIALALTTPASAAEPACDVAHIQTVPELNALLQKRAVEVIDLASRKPTKKIDARLAELVAPDAVFELGAGDLGRGTERNGPEGAREIARWMTANMYMVEGWDYMSMPAETPCGEQKVTVEFLDNRIKRRCQLAFTFVNGRVTNAQGWERTYKTGPVTPPNP